MRQYSYYHHLKNKWTEKNQKIKQDLLSKHPEISKSDRLKQHLIGGLMLASTPFLTATPSAIAIPSPVPTPEQTQSVDNNEKLITTLTGKLPKDVRPLTPSEEEDIAATLSANFRMRVAPQLDGIRLNRTYGIIGQEQHLPRYPGDSVWDQLTSEEESITYARYGMTPGRGAWGYFATSKSELSPKDIEREKYYIAVQTFLAPGWNEYTRKYKEFFKYRKMLLVNAENGKAIVADVADAGPAASTGKHLGGSPEVMKHLQRVDGKQRGPVLYFFIDDPDDTIPLGPVHI